MENIYRYGKCKVSIHAPREGCDQRGRTIINAVDVSIHAPREGCDLVKRLTRGYPGGFNSRTPGGVRHTEGSIY